MFCLQKSHEMYFCHEQLKVSCLRVYKSNIKCCCHSTDKVASIVTEKLTRLGVKHHRISVKISDIIIDIILHCQGMLV